jgi:transcriptional regulator with XRE-family HTH domain
MSSNNHKMMNELEALLSFDNDQEKLELETELLHLKFIKLIEKIMQQEGKNKADIAQELKTSKSYITQLFSGDKLINVKTLAKLQRIFNVSFNVEATRKRSSFKAVDCGKFRKIYNLNFIEPGVNSRKYNLENQPPLKLVV